jgi:hypothetical protein
MKRNLLPRAILATVLLALPAAADAPTNPPQYAQFLGDTDTITDNFTHLQWDRRTILSGLGRGAQLSDGVAICSTLPVFKPLNNGRLPTIKELLTLLDEQPHNEYESGSVVPKMIDQLAFDGTPVDLPYWSSTPAGGGMYWTLSFRTGAMQALPAAGPAHVRCVR